MLLDVKNIDVLYDDFQVIWDVSINVNKAEMVALLGPNGSGKSTVLNTISNLVEHKKGSISFDNTLISNIPTYRRTELGISHVLERRRVFPHLTVKQNLLLGAWHPKAKEELSNCSNHFENEIKTLNQIQTIVALGKVAFDNCVKYYKRKNKLIGKFTFKHGKYYNLSNKIKLYACYHPSPRNVNTKLISEKMIVNFFKKIKRVTTI